MGQVDNLKAARRAARMNDPHEWAFEIERLADQRSLFGAIAFLMALALSVSGWMSWQAIDRLSERVASLESVRHAEAPKPRQIEVSPEVAALVEKYAPEE